MAYVLLFWPAMGIATAFESLNRPDLPQQFGAYRVMERIAEGGTATVFRAENPETGRSVALKTVRMGLSHEIAVLAHEIAMLRGLRHPGIVRFVADGKCAGIPWMAVELLPGRTLFEAMIRAWADEAQRPTDRGTDQREIPNGQHGLQHDRPTRGDATRTWDSTPTEGNWVFSLQEDPSLAFPSRPAAAGHLEDALIVIKRLVPALEYIHSRGVVHGDVKPPNVQLGDDGRVTLMDFGAAHRPRSRRDVREMDGLRMGTMEYAAPEQIAGHRIDVTTDIYSLGCILYEMITGRIPFEGESHQDIGRKHIDQDPVGPTELVAGVWWELEDLVMDMLAKKPNRRPRSARSVAARIAPLLRRCQQQMPQG